MIEIPGSWCSDTLNFGSSIDVRGHMFRCPHCCESTITVGEKLKASGWSGRQCPKCEGMFAPSWFGALLASTVAVLGMVAPLILLSPFSFDRAWLVLGLGGFLGLVVGLLTYLFATPLVAVGTVTARYDRIGYIVLVVGLILIALANEYLSR